MSIVRETVCLCVSVCVRERGGVGERESERKRE